MIDRSRPTRGALPEKPAGPTKTEALFASVFGSDDGLKVLAVLREATIERGGMGLSESALREIEGQRHLVRGIEARVAAGLMIDAAGLRRMLPASKIDDKEGGAC